MDIKLRALSLDDGDDVYNFLQELGPGENGFWNPAFGCTRPDGFRDYLKWNVDCSLGQNLPEDRVQQTIYWLVVGNEIVGMGKLRHYLNDKLKAEGGHIGYSVKPASRGKGYGNQILRLLLLEAKSLGIDEVLLTISESNIASQATARNNDALRDKVVGEKGYWLINLS